MTSRGEENDVAVRGGWHHRRWYHKARNKITGMMSWGWRCGGRGRLVRGTRMMSMDVDMRRNYVAGNYITRDVRKNTFASRRDVTAGRPWLLGDVRRRRRDPYRRAQSPPYAILIISIPLPPYAITFRIFVPSIVFIILIIIT